MPQALALTGLHQLGLVAYEDVPLGRNEVLVRTGLASPKRGTLRARMFWPESFAYTYDRDTGELTDTEQTPHLPTPDDPLMLAATIVGTVEQAGDEVRGVTAGQRVFGVMGLRETNRIGADRVWPLDGVDAGHALLFDPAYVAFHAIRESKVRLGDTVAIVGLGAIGLMAVRMAKCAGAGTIVAIGNSDLQREWALRLGADQALDISSPALASDPRWLMGGGADVTIEAAGAYAALDVALRITRARGTVCSLGFYQGESAGLRFGREWHHNQLTIIVPHGCGRLKSPRDYPRWTERRARETIVSMLRSGAIAAGPLLGPVVDFQDTGALAAALRPGQPDSIRCIVSFNGCRGGMP